MVLPAPTDPSRMAQLNEESYARVISRLQTMVGVLVLDCGTGLQEPAARAAQAAADQIVLISDAHPATASLVAEAAELLRTVGPPLTLVVNKMPRKRDARLDLGGMERLVPDAQGLSDLGRGPAVGDARGDRRLLVGRRAAPVAARHPRAGRDAPGRLAGAGDHQLADPRLRLRIATMYSMSSGLPMPRVSLCGSSFSVHALQRLARSRGRRP